MGRGVCSVGWLVGVAAVAAACGKTATDDKLRSAPAASASTPPAADGGSAEAAPPVATVSPITTCHEAPLTGAPMPPALAPYVGTCPTIGKTPDLVTFTGSSKDRTFLVVRPADEAPDEILPVLFVWPWLNATVELTRAAWQLDDATKTLRFIAVVPVPKGDLPDDFPYDITVGEARVAEEVQYFDDMLACVAAEIPRAALHCVSTLGMSAGALFSAQLVARRSERLASFVSLSGGVGGVIRDLAPLPAHKLPSLVAWGGPNDRFYAVDFEQTSIALEGKLAGHAVVECVHDCGHDMPPFDPPLRTLPAFRFALDHPYGLPPGTSAYAEKLPDTFPSWCAYGVGKTVARHADGGACPAL